MAKTGIPVEKTVAMFSCCKPPGLDPIHHEHGRRFVSSTLGRKLIRLMKGYKADPLSMLNEQNPVTDRLGSTELLLAATSDGKSVRGFNRDLDGEFLDPFLKPGEDTFLVDSQSGREWDFIGTAIHGPREGRRLERIQILKDFWFGWKLYDADTTAFSAGKVPGCG